jgi:hypothetical protein
MSDMHEDVILNALEQVAYYLSVEADDEQYRAIELITLVETAIARKRAET